MSIILDSENAFKLKLYDALEWLYPNQLEYIFTPKYCSYDLIVRDKKLYTQVYIEHKQRNIHYLETIKTSGLMFNRCKLSYYQKYLSSSLVIIATTFNDTSYWTVYDSSMNELPTTHTNQTVVFLPFHTFRDTMDELAMKIILYLK